MKSLSKRGVLPGWKRGVLAGCLCLSLLAGGRAGAAAVALSESRAPGRMPQLRGVSVSEPMRSLIEADGNAYFQAPVGKVVYFQALDERGMAAESMRSGTYVHPDERLTCQGCHERKHRPPSVPKTMPLALMRPPSKLRPEPDGSNPFSYARLVQPVLDRHCVDCHQQQKALDLSGVVGGPHGWTRSYTSLAAKYGSYYHLSNGSINSGIHGGSRTVPGKFGARASRLREYLDQRHYGLSLPQEDLHRLTLWLDCNSEFYGAYHRIEAQARGRWSILVWTESSGS